MAGIWTLLGLCCGIPICAFGQADLLPIENLSIWAEGTDYSRVTFNVVNRSSKPILGYGVGLQFVSSDGKRATREKASDGKRDIDVVHADFTVMSPEPPQMGVSTLAQMAGPLLPGRTQERTTWIRTGPHGPIPPFVEPLVLFVVFGDNSVAGDIERAKREFFMTQKTVCAEYEWYLRELRKAMASSDGGVKEIDLLCDRFRYALSTNLPVLFSNDVPLSLDQIYVVRHSLYPIYYKIRHELDAAKRELSRPERSPVQVVQDCMKWVEAQLAFHRGHLEPRY